MAAKIDRQTTTPFLLKLFYRIGSFHRLDDFPPSGPLPPHLQIYTWPSCTLRELTHLLTSALPSLLPDPAIGTRVAFRLVFPDTRSPPSAVGRYISKDLGSVVVAADPEHDGDAVRNGGGVAVPAALEGEPEKSLQDVRFVIGDFVSCAIFPPLANGAVAPPPFPGSGGSGIRGGVGSAGNGPPPASSRMGGYGGPRENGYGDGPSRRGSGRGGYGGGPEFGRGGGGFGGGGGRGDGFGGLPNGEWRRGERVPGPGLGSEGRGFAGGGGGGDRGGGGYGRGRGRGGGGREW